MSGSKIPTAVLVAAVALMTACGSSSTDIFVAPQVIEETTFDPSLDIDLSEMTRTSSGLYVLVLEEGEGPQAAARDSVTVDYTGWLSDGTVFDIGSVPQYELGVGLVVAGFDEGVIGMRVGERRRIIIPPALGFGNQQVGIIPPGSILIFNIELTSLIET